MSIFARVSSYGGEQRMLRARGFYAVIGRDAQGVMTMSEDASPLLSAYRCGLRLAVRSEAVIPLKSGRTLISGDLLWSESTIVLDMDDMNLELGSTSSTAEALAEQEISTVHFNHVESWPVLTFALAGLKQEFLLPPSIPLTIGSSKSAPIQVTMAGIEVVHAEVEFHGKSVSFRPRDGACTIGGNEFSESVVLRKTTVVTVGSPGLGLPLTIRLRG